MAQAVGAAVAHELLLLAQALRFGSGRACRLCPGNSDVDLLRNHEGVVNLDPEVTDRALDLGVA
jgi:hypothetical protein